MKTLPSVILAFAAAASVPAAYAAMTTPVAGPPDLASWELWFPIVFCITSLFLLTLGGPLFFLGRRYGFISWWSAPLAGVLIGLIAAEVLWAPHPAPFASVENTCAAGAASGFAWWLVWRFTQPPEVRNDKSRRWPP